MAGHITPPRPSIVIDELHLFLTPVAIGKGKHLFADIDTAPHLALMSVTNSTAA